MRPAGDIATGRPLGAIQLDTQDRTKKFVTDDLNLLTIVANLASVAIEKARMHETVLAREKEQKEIELARKVQLGFLPQTLPEVAGYEFYSHYSPAQTVGGDYYDFVLLPGGRVAVVLGDVAGKGVPAALLVAKLSSEVRFCLVTEPDAAKAITQLNDQMIRGGLQDRFVTLAVLVLEPRDAPSDGGERRAHDPEDATAAARHSCRGDRARRHGAAAGRRCRSTVMKRRSCRWNRATPSRFTPTA